MLGPPKTRCLGRPVLVSLEGLVPAGHFYRHREAALGLGFVRDWVAGFYNRQRAHSALAYQPPARFEEMLLLQNSVA